MKKYTILTLLVLFFAQISFAQKPELQRVEPMFWWAGMKSPKLQLLVYGKNIAETKVSFKYEGVKLESVVSVENPNYLFLNLHISAKAKAGKFVISFTKGKKEVLTYNYELKQRVENSAQRKGFDASDVIYLIMPDRFANGNPENDNMPEMLEKANREDPNGRHGGDLQGIINKLDYLEDLGVTSLWLNPVQENNMPQMSYHGYAISDIYKIDPRFGDNNLYKELVQKANKKGLSIVMDFVFNHLATEHFTIKDRPMSNWVHETPEFHRTSYRGSVNIDPYISKKDKNTMLQGWFDHSMGDLDQRNPLVANYLIQASIWWVEFAGLSGIRMDTQIYPYKEFMSAWGARMQEEYPNFSLLGEVWIEQASYLSYFQGNANNADGYQSNLTSVTDFAMKLAIQNAFNEEDSWNDGLLRIFNTLGEDFLYSNPNSNVIFLDNHDLSRFYSTVGKDLRKMKMATAFLLTTRGIPQIYYAIEILSYGHEHEGHGFIRKDFPGGWAADKTDAFTKEGRTDEQNDYFNYIKTLLNWRKGNKVISEGKLTHFLPQNNLYVYFKELDGKAVMVILNNNDKENKQLGDVQRYMEILANYKSGKNVITGEAYSNFPSITIKAKSAVVIELK